MTSHRRQEKGKWNRQLFNSQATDGCEISFQFPLHINMQCHFEKEIWGKWFIPMKDSVPIGMCLRESCYQHLNLKQAAFFPLHWSCTQDMKEIHCHRPTTAKGHLFCLLVFFQFNILRATALLLSNECIRSSLSFLLLPAIKSLFESASLHPKSLLHTSGWFSCTFTAFHIKVLWFSLSKNLELVLKNESGDIQN